MIGKERKAYRMGRVREDLLSWTSSVELRKVRKNAWKRVVVLATNGLTDFLSGRYEIVLQCW